MATRSLDNSSSRLLLSEILRKVSNAKTKKEKIDLLRKHNTPALRQLLIWNFDESVVSMVPEGEVPYTPNDAPVGTDHTRLEQEYRGFYRFVKGGQDRLPSLKRESMFVQLLEGLSAEEAELVCLVKDKKLSNKYKRITKTVVSEAFPSIEWGGRS
jgi:hypothetical protein|tara:strand:- start:420 stop:887 length:468 start_codon:yes stop_codon:yes gene_type:complete